MNTGYEQQIRSFFASLGISEKMTNAFVASSSTNHVLFLENVVGAKQIGYRKNLRSIPEIASKGIILPAGLAVITTVFPDGKRGVLVQLRDDGYVGFPGGSGEVWRYADNFAVEPPLLATYREFLEEVGEGFEESLKFIGENTSTIRYPNGDIVYAVSLFYGAEAPYELVARYAKGTSEEGEMVLLPIDFLEEENIFENHAPIFEQLLMKQP